MTAPLRLLMTAQAIDQDHPILGFSHTWAAKLAGLVERLHVVTLHLGKHDLPSNVTVTSLGGERGSGKLAKLIAFHRAVAPLVLGRKVDGIFVQQTEINAILAAPYAKLLRVPLVLFKGHSRSLRPSLRVANALIDRALTSTPAAYPIDTPKKVVTGQGIDVDVFTPALAPEGVPAGGQKRARGRKKAGGPKRIISVGRLAPIKRYAVQIEAANILINQKGRKDFTLHIYGGPDPPSHAAELTALIKNHGLEETVFLEGPMDFRRMPEVYRGAHALVHTCATESLDKAVLEAMACGVPAITSIQSYRPVMGVSADTLVCRPGDAADLAAKMEGVLALPSADYHTLGSALRDTVVRDHSVDRLVAQLVEVIQELRRGKSPRREASMRRGA